MICYIIALLFSACDSDYQKEKIDTSAININYSSVRFDEQFFNIDTNNITNGIEVLGRTHPDFTNLFLTNLAALGQPGTARFDTAVRQFLTHPDYRALWDTVQKHYPNTKEVDNELMATFKNIKYFYPEENVGQVYYFVSGLNMWSAITIDSAVGVGLDMYLGADFPFYASVQIPAYESRNRTKERISVEVARAIFEAKFPFQYEGKTLLDMMLYKGKELYFTEQVCREKTDAQLIGFSPQQIEWCNNSEEMIYYFFVNGKYLYATTWQEIMPYINDGPNTPGMPSESPGNMGSWLGWQIIRQYMKSHPNMGLSELMKLKTPAQQFLHEAKYKP